MHTQLFRPWQVSNAVQQPLSQFPHEEIKKNSVIALYAGEDEDNHGLPFFLGKVLSVSNQNKSDRDEDEDEDESDEAIKYVVSIHDYIQTESNDGKPTGKYILHNEHGERKKGSNGTRSKAVTAKVPIGQIVFLIDKMNGNKSIPKNTMSLLSFNCEVADGRNVFKCPGWRKFVVNLGLKPMPE